MQLGGLGERCKLAQWGLGPNPSGNPIFVHSSLAVKSDSGGIEFSENQLTTAQCQEYGSDWSSEVIMVD